MSDELTLGVIGAWKPQARRPFETEAGRCRQQAQLAVKPDSTLFRARVLGGLLTDMSGMIQDSGQLTLTSPEVTVAARPSIVRYSRVRHCVVSSCDRLTLRDISVRRFSCTTCRATSFARATTIAGSVGQSGVDPWAGAVAANAVGESQHAINICFFNRCVGQLKLSSRNLIPNPVSLIVVGDLMVQGSSLDSFAKIGARILTSDGIYPTSSDDDPTRRLIRRCSAQSASSKKEPRAHSRRTRLESPDVVEIR
jgi:hypothetical protein